MVKKNILTQIKNNAVALISLVIALSSLSYNTWRNEQTEENRNQRQASFQILLTLNELQQLVFHHHYDKDTKNKGNLRTGWSYVLSLQDFAMILQSPFPKPAEQLHQVWSENSQYLATDETKVKLVTASIDDLRTEILILLKSLD
jgi:hypothetical protein